MFEGMDVFDMDPYKIQDMPTEYNKQPQPQPQPQSGMGQFQHEELLPGGPSLPPTVPPMPQKVGGIFSKVGEALQARYQAKMGAKAAQLQALQQQGQISQYAYEAQMRKIMEQKNRSSFMSKYGVLVILGAIFVAGGVGVYIFTRRR